MFALLDLPLCTAPSQCFGNFGAAWWGAPAALDPRWGNGAPMETQLVAGGCASVQAGVLAKTNLEDLACLRRGWAIATKSALDHHDLCRKP